MCGITGFCDFTMRSNKELLGQMNNTLQHRGPDADGLYYEQTDAYTLGLGHKRLSIIDLSPNGAQPMHFEHLSIVFNGEVYNYREIKKELLEKGYSFISDSDTEVVLKAFDCWQHEAVHRFIGMFAFAIFNKKTKQLHLYRDRAGVKPLYYRFRNGILLFGSELKALMAHPALDKTLDRNALSFYLKSGYYHAPHTVFEHCKKLEPGHYLTLHIPRQQVSTTCYWNVIDFYNRPARHVQEDELLFETEQLMQSAFNYRMVADVPVGVFLSGGYDSSAVAALLQKDRTQKIKTFTIGFHEEGFNEAPFAKQIAQHLGTEHYEYYCTQKEAHELLPQIPFFYDEPFADSSAIPTMLISAFAREQVTVALSADGGDELFGGYGKYLGYNRSVNHLFKIPFYIRKQLLPVCTFINRIPSLSNKEIKSESLFALLSSRNLARYFIEPRLFGERELSSLLVKQQIIPYGSFENFNDFNNSVDAFNQMLAVDYKTYMVDDILTKVDRATMSVSLEGREPLIDHRLVEFLSVIPSRMKLSRFGAKGILKSIVHNYLPIELMMRKKSGFGIPLHQWLSESIIAYLNEEETRKKIKLLEIFNFEYIDILINNFLKKDNNTKEYYFTKLYYIYSWLKWHDEWN